jgi:hypothetical protein
MDLSSIDEFLISNSSKRFPFASYLRPFPPPPRDAPPPDGLADAPPPWDLAEDML